MGNWKEIPGNPLGYESRQEYVCKMLAKDLEMKVWEISFTYQRIPDGCEFLHEEYVQSVGCNLRWYRRTSKEVPEVDPEQAAQEKRLKLLKAVLGE